MNCLRVIGRILFTLGSVQCQGVFSLSVLPGDTGGAAMTEGLSADAVLAVLRNGVYIISMCHAKVTSRSSMSAKPR